MQKTRLLGAVLALALGTAGAAHAVVFGQVDDFEDGSTQGWSGGAGGSPTPPVNTPDDGPLGVGDAFLRIQGRGGVQAGSKPTAFNTLQWTGNYTGAGVARISADLRNSGQTQLDLRFQFRSATGNLFVTAAVILPAGSGWVRATWPVDAASLIPVDAIPGDPAEALGAIAELRIFHSPEAVSSTLAPAIVADLGIDNIRAEGAAADRDADGVPDASDNCPFLPNAAQLDGDGNGRGNACECGDQNGDGTVDVLDLVAINLAIFNPIQIKPLCDANGDRLCTVNDIVSANLEIFSPGNTSTCEAQPQPGP